MNLFFFQSPAKNLKDNMTTDVPDPVYMSAYNISDGLEFLDDAIRTKDQPLMYTQKRITQRIPKDVCEPKILYNNKIS